MKKKIILILFSLLALSSFAEKITVDLDNAVDTAKQKEKSIKKAEVDVKNYKLQKNEAFKSGLPKLSYSGTFGKKEKVGGEDTFNQYLLTLTQPLFNGFKILTAIENSDKYLDLGKLKLENTKNQIGLETTKIFVDIEKYKKQLIILKNSQKVLEKNYTRVNRSYELGFVTKTEVLDLKHSMIEVETNIIQLENMIETNEINLKNSLGISIDQKIETEEIKNNEIDVLAINVEKDIEKAKKGNIAIQMQQIVTELTRASEVTQRADLLPAVNLSANYGNIGTVQGEISEAFKDENMSWTVGINVSGTLFSWGQKHDAYQRAKNQTTQAEYDEKITQENIELGIKSAYLELLRLDKLKEARKKAYESSKENFRLQEKSYENQLIVSTDFLKAENELREAEINLIETDLDLYYAYQNYLTLIK